MNKLLFTSLCMGSSILGAYNTNKKNDKLAIKLAKMLSDKLRAENSPMPTYKDSGEKCQYPDEIL